MKKPSLYLSDYFEKHKAAYYDALTRVRTSNDMGHWIKMFLVAVIVTANKGRETFQQILILRNKSEAKIMQMGRRAKSAQKLLGLLYREPTVSAMLVQKKLKLGKSATHELIEAFKTAGILTEVTGLKRNRLFQFRRYFHLFLK